MFCKNLCLFFVVSFCVLSSNLWASDIVESSESATEQLLAILSDIKTVEGSFVQFTIDQRGVKVQQSAGEFKAAKPNRFVWLTEAPLEQEIYVDGAEVVVFDPDLEQATIQILDEQLQVTPAMLFSGKAEQITQSYAIEKQKSTAEAQQFLLFPHQPDSLFEKLRIRFENGKLSYMRISDSLGQDTTVSFDSVKVNRDIPVEEFKAVLPEGTDVIRDLPLANGS